VPSHRQHTARSNAQRRIPAVIGARQTWCPDRALQLLLNCSASAVHMRQAQQVLPVNQSHSLRCAPRADALGTMVTWCAGWATGP
jgi:hypothetical protein